MLFGIKERVVGYCIVAKMGYILDRFDIKYGLNTFLIWGAHLSELPYKKGAEIWSCLGLIFWANSLLKMISLGFLILII